VFIRLCLRPRDAFEGATQARAAQRSPGITSLRPRAEPRGDPQYGHPRLPCRLDPVRPQLEFVQHRCADAIAFDEASREPRMVERRKTRPYASRSRGGEGPELGESRVRVAGEENRVVAQE